MAHEPMFSTSRDMTACVCGGRIHDRRCPVNNAAEEAYLVGGPAENRSWLYGGLAFFRQVSIGQRCLNRHHAGCVV